MILPKELRKARQAGDFISKLMRVNTLSKTPTRLIARFGKALVASYTAVFVCIIAFLGLAYDGFATYFPKPDMHTIPWPINAVIVLVALALSVWTYFAEVIESLKNSQIQMFKSVLRDINFDEMAVQNYRLGRERPLVPLRVSNFNNFLTYVPFYISRHMGFFEEEDLQIEILHHHNDLHAVDAASVGHSAIAIADPAFCFEEGMHEGGMKIVAPFIQRVALWAVSKRPLKDYKSHEPVAIKTYSEGSTAAMQALRLKKDFNLQGARIEFVEFKSGETFAKHLTRILKSDKRSMQPDILVISEPEATWMCEDINDAIQEYDSTYKHKTPLYADVGSLFTAVVTSQSYLARSPEAIRRFLKALRLGLLYMQTLPPLPEVDNAQKGSEAWLALVNDTIKASQTWVNVITAVRSHIAEAYPPGFDKIPDNKMAHIIDGMIKSSFFPISYAINKNTERHFVHAYYSVENRVLPSDWQDKVFAKMVPAPKL